MKPPVLIVMAAGMGSRYGGLKQLDPVGPHGELILDYSVYDAHRAGFQSVLFVIKREMESSFRTGIGDRLSKIMDVAYAFQDKSDLPEGYRSPADREKPWGTAQAVLAARNLVEGSFAVINADDYYGPKGFQDIYRYLLSHPDGAWYEYAMVSYLVKNTVTEHGHVARGVCQEDANGYLVAVDEHTRMEKDGENARYSDDGGATWVSLSGASPVSMNLWGFTQSFLTEAWERFPAFLDRALAEEPRTAEYFLPSVVSELLSERKARVKVLTSHDKWYGVTYQEDKAAVVAAMKEMTDQGLYPQALWTG